MLKVSASAAAHGLTLVEVDGKCPFVADKAAIVNSENQVWILKSSKSNERENKTPTPHIQQQQQTRQKSQFLMETLVGDVYRPVLCCA